MFYLTVPFDEIDCPICPQCDTVIDYDDFWEDDIIDSVEGGKGVEVTCPHCKSKLELWANSYLNVYVDLFAKTKEDE